MEISHIKTDKKRAGKAAWVIYAFCTVIMGAMAYFNSWAVWITVVLALSLIVLTFLTFYPQSPERLQSVFMMLLSFANIFICSIAERSIYPAMLVFLGAAILLSAYRSEKLLLIYSVLTAVGILFHIIVLNTVEFDTSLHIVQFIVRTVVMFTAQLFLMVLVSRRNSNGEIMRKSMEAAKQAEHDKSDFLANMSHEIRTPMNAIIGMCELILRENALSDSVRENCFNIQTSGKSLLAIINDILDFSKIESGNMELINNEFNIVSVLNDVINLSEARKRGKKIEIIVNADPDIPRGLIGDEMRIRQVLINLMTNAIKFTERGSVTLTVSCTVQEYGVNLFVSVADTGIGITEENIEKLFTSFHQVDTRKNRSVEGTGLGLAISKRLVGQMGGFISVKSEYEAGTEFRFVIPMKVANKEPFVSIKEPDEIHAVACFGESESAEKQGRIFCEMGQKMGADFRCAESIAQLKALVESEDFTHILVNSEEYRKDSEFFASAAENMQVFVVRDRSDTISLPDSIQSIYKPFYVVPAVSALNQESLVLNLNERRAADISFTAPKARILIVDDNIVNLKVSTGLMQPYNMQIMTARSGPEAIEILQSKDIDLVFMDHMMAGMDGVEATRIIRGMEGEYYQKLPVIALTANAVNGARELFLNSGFNDFLAKPIELSVLDRILRKNLPKEYMQAPTKNYYTRWGRRKSDMSEGGNSPLLDVKKGIAYIGGNEEAYKEILFLYIKESEKKIKQIAELFEQGDIETYCVEVHALKGASMSIGAIRLFELAKELEAVAKAGNLNAVERKNSVLLKLYGEVAEAARKYLGDMEAAASQQEEVETAELSEISIDVLQGYLERAKAACRGFDGDRAEEVAAETAGYSFGGEPLRDYFGKAAQLAKDFEYEDAEQELIRLEEIIKNKGRVDG